MPDFRYAQLCPLARTAEVLSDRWTLLLVRELLLSPLRFRDLQRRLPGISSSVLSERLQQLEGHGVCERHVLPSPASATVYALTPDGEALREPLLGLARWGLRFFGRGRPGDYYDPAWVQLGFEMAARRGPVPERRYRVSVEDADPPLQLWIAGGPEGTRVTRAAGEPAGPADAGLSAPSRVLLALLLGEGDVGEAHASGALRVEAPESAAVDELLRDFARLFARPLPPAPREAVPNTAPSGASPQSPEPSQPPTEGPMDPGV